ncbi:lipase family protein [Williamsia muralis]|uniref:lipase family protein n=1 Tax=Williamsia marianensis TaxID=85044 RepID=UPI00117C19FE|nr:lipase family protein [Williamsia marianensis]
MDQTTWSALVGVQTKSVFGQQRIGTLTPQAPMPIVVSDNDDVVPRSGLRDVAREWCGRGAPAAVRHRVMFVEPPQGPNWP